MHNVVWLNAATVYFPLRRLHGMQWEHLFSLYLPDDTVHHAKPGQQLAATFMQACQACKLCWTQSVSTLKQSNLCSADLACQGVRVSRYQQYCHRTPGRIIGRVRPGSPGDCCPDGWTCQYNTTGASCERSPLFAAAPLYVEHHCSAFPDHTSMGPL